MFLGENLKKQKQPISPKNVIHTINDVSKHNNFDYV